MPLEEVLRAIPFDSAGLVCVVTQQYDSGEVLMVAWANRAAIDETLSSGWACYWSRSRQALWRKGETSGCRQRLVEMRLDCDGDALLYRVDQHGGACHTGRRSCFYNLVSGDRVVLAPPPLPTSFLSS